MKQQKQFWRKALSFIGIGPNGKEVSESLNRQNLVAGLVVMGIDICVIIWHLYKLSTADHKLLNGLALLVIDVVMAITCIALIIYSIVELKQKKDLSRWWITGCIYLFIFLLLIQGFLYSIFDDLTKVMFVPLLMTFIWGFIVFNIRPIVPFVYMVLYIQLFHIWGLRQQSIETIDFGSIDMLFLSVVVCSFIRYHAARVITINRLKVVKANEQLHYSSTHDELTGIKNRVSLKEDLPAYFGQNITVILCDIDYFKHINDTYGHEMGDTMLKTFAENLTKYASCDNIYRYGGDEFLIVCKEGNMKSEAFNRNYPVFPDKLMIPGTDDPITGCAGIVTSYCNSMDDFLTIMKQADDRLYLAKGEGRNRIHK